MKVDAILAALKFAAVLITGILGALGLLVDYKDKQGKITKWGRRALIAVVISAFVAVTSQGLEVYKQKREAAEAEVRRNEQTSAFNQLLYPLRDIYVTAMAEMPLNHPKMASYFTRLDQGAHRFIESHSAISPTGNTFIFTNTDIESGKVTPIGVHLSSGASLFPNRQRDKLAWRALVNFGVEVDVYKKPIDPNKYQVDHLPPDLHFRANADKVELLYLLGQKTIEITGQRMKVTRENDWRSNGTITSIPDLLGTQIFITFKDYDTGDDEVDVPYLEMEQQAKIGFFSLQASNQNVFIPWDKFQMVPKSKYPAYFFTLRGEQ